MNKVNHLRLFATFLLILFLFLFLGFGVSAQVGSSVVQKHFSISQHSGIGIAESQLPFEEKEEENGQDSTSGYGPLFCVKGEYPLSDFINTGSYAPLRTFSYRNTLPIYLAKRALLI
jgi:hypothetical protein